MLDRRRLMVVVDVDDEQHLALDRVQRLESIDEFTLRLVSCDYSRQLHGGIHFGGLGIPDLRVQYLSARERALDALAAPLLDQGIRVETAALWGHPPYHEIIHEVHRWEPDMLIHSARRHSRISRLFLTNEDWQLVRTCPCPLLLIKDKPWTHEPGLIAAVDPMHDHDKPAGLDHKIIRAAEDFARILDGQVHVLHACGTWLLPGIYREKAGTNHEQSMDALLEDFDVPDDRVHVVDSPVEEAIPSLAQDLDADLVVMGAISRTLLSETIIGNTAERVLDYLRSDVLIIKPDEYVSPVSPD